MVDVFLAQSVNSKIYYPNDKFIFNKYTSEELYNIRNNTRNKYKTIIVGANTIKNDNPTLLNKKQNNIRIIVDKYCDLKKDSKIFLIRPEQTYLILLKRNVEYEEYLKKIGVNILYLQDSSEQNIIEVIKSICIGDVLIEGGSKIISFFLNNNFIDNIITIQFPFLLPNNSLSLCNILKKFILLELRESYILENKYIYSCYKLKK